MICLVKDTRLQRRVRREIRRLANARGTRGEVKATARLVVELQIELRSLDSLFQNLNGVDQEDLRNKCQARILINDHQTFTLKTHLKVWAPRLQPLLREEDRQDMRDKCAAAAESRMRASAV